MEIIYNIKWNWEDMCGPEGLQPWNEKTHDIGICFQELVLNIPILFMLATISGYYVNLRVNFVTRGKVQENVIRIRSILVLFLTFLPIIKIYTFITESSSNLFAIDYFLCATECLTWFVHFGYALALKNRLGINPRGPILILFCWSTLVVLNIMLLRTRILLGVPFGYNIAVVVIHFFYGLTLIPSAGECSPTFYSPCLVGSQISQFGEHLPLLHSEEIGMLGTAMQGVNPLSKLLFYWVEPLFQRGLEKKLTHADDLFDLPPDYRASNVSRKIDAALIGNIDNYRTFVDKTQTSTYQGYGATEETSAGSCTQQILPPVVVIKPTKRYNVSLFRSLHSCFGICFYSIGILKFATDMAGFAGPVLLNKLVQFIEDDSIELKYGYYYAGGLLLSTIISAFCNAHFNMLMSLIGLKLRTAIITTVLRKTLSVTSTELHKSFTIGEITNFMSTDTDRIVNSCPSFHAVWSIPLQMSITLYLLYNQVGMAFMAGVVFILILIPINKAIAEKIGNLSKDLMDQKDKRVSVMSEIIKGIRCIKLYVWEDYFIQRITNVRLKELNYLRGRKYLDALCVFFWATTPILVATLTLSTYVLLGNQLDAATVFTSVALMNMLIAPLNAFPWVLNGLTEAWVSVKRIQKLLELPDLDEDLHYSQINSDEKDDYAIILRNATFSWTRSSFSRTLPTTVKTKKNKGKGKKSKPKGNIQRRDSSPDPSNDENESLIQPFSLIGISLSIETGHLVGVIGRVGSGKTSLLKAILAEMLKQDGEIAISENIDGYGYVSQDPWLQRGTVKDNILFGKVYEESKYRTVIDACGLSDDLMILGDKAAVGESGCTLSGGQRARVALARAVYQDKQVYLLDDVLSAVDVKVAHHIFTKCIMGLLRYKTRILVTHSVRFLANANIVILMENGHITKQGRPDTVLDEMDEILDNSTDLSQKAISVEASVESTHYDNISLKDDGSTNSIMDEEHMATGNVELWVLGLYLKSVGGLLSIAILLSLTLMQLSQNFTFVWLSYWVSSERPSHVNMTSTLVVDLSTKLENDNEYYLWVYVGLAGINCLLTLLRAFLFAYGGVLAASRIHKNLLKVIVKAKVKFFDITPSGRILNRFSSDTYTVDDSLPFIFNILLAQVFGLLGSLIVCLYGLPWLCLVLVPLLPVYLWLQNQYRGLSQHLKRLQTVTLSPIYSYFNDILQGLTTIHAFRASSRCLSGGEDLVDASQRATLASAAAAQWLTLRLQLMGVAVVSSAALVAVAKRHFDTIDPGMVGLAISYALSLTSFLSSVMNAFPETERELVSVERLGEYLNQVESEDTFDQSKFNTPVPPLYGWPTQGVVSFHNVVMKYRDHLSPALKGVTFESRPAEKIGVVGRTGAGKSSLFAALLRLSEIQSGNIFIDQVNISNLTLNALRSRIAIIPQEPFIFEGSVLENIDPLGEYSESEVWAALEKCGARAGVIARGGLQGNAGQLARGLMQQLCLVRALLHNAKILCIDEATANIDHETDRLIQATIRNSFKQSTVITIAHRISTVLESDRVLVMGDGQILEFDAPDILLQDSQSHFSQLINQESDL